MLEISRNAARNALHLVLVLSGLAAGGCGYQLRGSVALPTGLDGIYIAGPADIAFALARVLESGGIRVQATRDSANAVVRLSDERRDQRVLSVNPTTGKESEFELAYRITFRVTDGEGEELVPSQTVSLVRDYVFDPDAVLGKSRERGVLEAEMRRDAAGQIVRRIQATLGS